MTAPALVPGVGVLAGVVSGLLTPFESVRPPLVVLGLIWILLAVALRQRWPWLVVVLATVGFAAATHALAVQTKSDALRPSLRVAFERVESRAHPAHEDPEPPLERSALAFVEGWLSEDAAVTPAGVSLRVAVTHVAFAGPPQPVRGGIRVTVGGALAPERAREWRAGRLVRFPAQLRRPARHLDPGVPDYERRLALAGTTLVGSVKSGALVEVLRPGDRFSEAAAALRAAGRRTLDELVGRWSGQSAAVVKAVLLGDRAGLTDEVAQRLQEAGTYHVLAISGGNIAILAGLVIGLFRFAGVHRRPASGAAIVLLIGYAFLVGGDPSVVRATLMAVTYFAAWVLDHRSPSLNALAAASGLIACATPTAVADAGFILTCGAALGIIAGGAWLVAQPLWRRLRSSEGAVWPRLARAGLALFWASVCAEAALLPVGALVFSRVTFAGLLLNFLAVPLMTAVQTAGLVALALATISGWLAMPAGWVAHLAAMMLVESARLVDLFPWLSLRVPPPPIPVVVAYYAGWVGLFALAPATRWRRAAAAVTLGMALWVLRAPAPAGSHLLRVTFLDVGQGDATLVQAPGGQSMLVDAGGLFPGASFDVGGRVVSPALWALGVRRLDVLAISHGDPDHIGGAPAILRDFRPREVWEGISVPAHRPLRDVSRRAARVGAAWASLQAGAVRSLGGAWVQVWHPGPADWERLRPRNDDSLVMEIRYGAVSIVLAGDIGREVERSIAERVASAGVRILKVPHHGSAGSSSQALIDVLEPHVAVVSAGRSNRFGHPAPDVLRRYRDAGVALFRTDRDGAVSVETDGQIVRLRTWTGRALSLGTDRHRVGRALTARPGEP